jgi:hypothetical protein
MDDPDFEQARLPFRFFYNDATPDDETLMDTLILAWVTVKRGASIPREVVPMADRGDLERACDKAEQAFMHARDRVRECPTFLELTPGDKRRIAAVLFDVHHAVD